MNRIFLAITLIFLSIGFLVAETIEKTYHFNNPEITNAAGYQQINFENCMLTALAGEPALPYQSVTLVLPPGHVATSIEITTGEEILMDGKFNLYPMQHAQPLSQGRSGIFVKDEALYQRDAIYPEKTCGEITTQFMNGYAVAICSFTPLTYNPVSGKVSYFKSVTIKIKTTEDTKSVAALQNLNSSPNVLNNVKSLVQNQEQLPAYPKAETRSGNYDMLIISPPIFAAGFEQLVDFYLPRGIIAQVITTDDIYTSMAGVDNPEKIRNFIIQEYQNNGIRYVTLGGDVEHVPYRGFYCSVQSSSLYEDENIPSDLYYAALDGTWNDDGDNRWGEIGEDDLLPEVGVGRFCVSSLADFDALMNKTIQYQQNPVLGELSNPLLVGEYLYDNPETWGSDYLELLIGYRNDNGYETNGIPETHDISKLYDHNGTWNKATLLAQMNQGSSFIHHVGHANSGYAMRLYNSDITNSNFAGLDGVAHNYALIYSHGCICGAFDDSDCIAERMINIENLAVAVFMNSRYGWFNEGQTEGPAAHINRELADAFYDKKESRLGTALNLARVATAPWVTAPGQWEEGALRWNFYDCNLLGDAALRFWTDEPIDISANYPDTITIGTASVSVTISGSTDVQGLCCSFIKNGICYGKANTDANGLAEIIFTEPLPETGDAAICVSGYNCLMHDYTVIVTEPLQNFQPVWNTPFNAMTFFVTGATIDNINMQAGDEIGIFDNDPLSGNEICVGAGTLVQQLSAGTFLEIVASMDDGSNPDAATGFTSGNEIIYKLWNATGGEISFVTATYPFPGYDEVFTPLGSAIVNLSGIKTNQHIITLPSGWSGISSYLIPVNTGIEEIFSGLSGQLEIIKNSDSFYQPGNISGTLETWNYKSGYLIKVTENTELTIDGTFPSDKSIILNTGWNLMPVISENAVSIENLFQADADKVMVIKDAVGFNVYWPSENITTLQNLQPGKAYLIKVSEGFSISFE